LAEQTAPQLADLSGPEKARQHSGFSKNAECGFLAISIVAATAQKSQRLMKLPTVERGGVFDEQVGRF
jgi:hypothetical protein